MRPVLDFNALKIFIAVVERDSFVGASKALEMPTSNVSRCISQLEDKLNLQLIERSTRHMKLTQAGHLLYTRAKPLLELPCITTVNALKGAPWQFVNKKGGFETIKVNGRYRVNSGEMAGRAAISGVGFAILSKQACQPYIDDGRLIEIEFEQSAAPLQLFALYSDRRYLPAKTRALIDFMHQRLSH